MPSKNLFNNLSCNNAKGFQDTLFANNHKSTQALVAPKNSYPTGIISILHQCSCIIDHWHNKSVTRILQEIKLQYPFFYYFSTYLLCVYMFIYIYIHKYINTYIFKTRTFLPY
ncbi:hypothetical protein CLU79DRAFT_778917 [Phycomyces nitens]|nr:hypothetical protein CLU79DRAFT_778917 [Phycomyces nitens]